MAWVYVLGACLVVDQLEDVRRRLPASLEVAGRSSGYTVLWLCCETRVGEQEIIRLFSSLQVHRETCRDQIPHPLAHRDEG